MSFSKALSQRFGLEKEDEALEIPGISELRNVDAKYSNCCVWEVEEPFKPDAVEEHLKKSKKKHRGPRHPDIIRFGSATDCMVHAVFRLVVLVDLMLVPFVLSFEYVWPLSECPVVHMLDGFTTFVYTVCVVQQFWTSYIDPKEMVEVKEPGLIHQYVLCSFSFFIDILSIVAVPTLYSHTNIRWCAGLRLLKCRRLFPDKARTMLLEDGTSIMPKLAQIVLVVYGCVHLYACAWFKAKVLSKKSYGREWSSWNGWSQDIFEGDDVNLDSYSLPIEPGDLTDLLLCYCRALRDGTFMVVTWGGPNALSFVELTTLVVMGPLLSCVMAYVYGYIVTIIGHVTAMQDQLSKQMHVLNAACLDMRVQTSLRLRICRYHSYRQAHHMDADAQALFQELSPNLVSETRVYRMRHMILSADVFQGLTPRLILILLSTSTEHLFSPGDLIVRRGEIADCMYIVMKGILSVLIGQTADIVVKTLHDNQMFGEACFLSDNEPRMAFVRAETFSVLSRFDRVSFDNVMMGHQDLKDDIREAILRTINKYKSSDAKNENIVSDLKTLQDDHDDHDEVQEVQVDCKEPEPDLMHPTLSINGLVERSSHYEDKMEKKLSYGGGGIAPMARQTSNGAYRSEGSSTRENKARQSSTGAYKSEDSSTRENTDKDAPLRTHAVKKTNSVEVMGTSQFRVAEPPLDASTRKTLNRESALKRLEPASFEPEQLSTPTPPLALQSWAQQAAMQALMKFSIGRGIQREAVHRLQEQAASEVAECKSSLARECQVMLGQLMCMEVAQKRLESMINPASAG